MLGDEDAAALDVAADACDFLLGHLHGAGVHDHRELVDDAVGQVRRLDLGEVTPHLLQRTAANVPVHRFVETQAQIARTEEDADGWCGQMHLAEALDQFQVLVEPLFYAGSVLVVGSGEDHVDGIVAVHDVEGDGALEVGGVAWRAALLDTPGNAVGACDLRTCEGAPVAAGPAGIMHVGAVALCEPDRLVHVVDQRHHLQRPVRIDRAGRPQRLLDPAHAQPGDKVGGIIPATVLMLGHLRVGTRRQFAQGDEPDRRNALHAQDQLVLAGAQSVVQIEAHGQFLRAVTGNLLEWPAVEGGVAVFAAQARAFDV